MKNDTVSFLALGGQAENGKSMYVFEINDKIFVVDTGFRFPEQDKLGVDIIIGHHPHVVQPIEFISDTLVVYSLGNFLSGQRGIEKLTGLMVSLDVVKDLETNVIKFDNIEAELLYTYSNYSKGYRGNFKVYPYTKLNESLLSNYETYYNKYMNIVLSRDINNRIQKGDYSGNSK